MGNKIAFFGGLLVFIFAVIVWQSLEATAIIRLTDGQVTEAQVVRFKTGEFVILAAREGQPQEQKTLSVGNIESIEFGKGKPLDVKYFVYAYGLAWVLLLGYAMNLGFRQKQVADELRSLQETLARRSAE